MMISTLSTISVVTLSTANRYIEYLYIAYEYFTKTVCTECFGLFHCILRFSYSILLLVTGSTVQQQLTIEQD